jgi:hypothetical protein
MEDIWRLGVKSSSRFSKYNGRIVQKTDFEAFPYHSISLDPICQRYDKIRENLCILR